MNFWIKCGFLPQCGYAYFSEKFIGTGGDNFALRKTFNRISRLMPTKHEFIILGLTVFSQMMGTSSDVRRTQRALFNLQLFVRRKFVFFCKDHFPIVLTALLILKHQFFDFFSLHKSDFRHCLFSLWRL